MNSYAIIDKNTNVVVNMAVWDGVSEWHPGDDYFFIQSDTASIGDVWDGTQLIKAESVGL